MGWVLFFDGDCAFCSKSVRQVVRFDKRGVISFAPLQGELSRKLGLIGYAEEGGGSVVLLRESDGKIFTHSDGPIQLARLLGGAWHLFALARFIPKPLRDAAYRWVARNRYRFMGKADSCSLPDPALLARLRE
jgi:predicted DCC family thiol-disulfide oxidoreductase YuxK